MCGVDTHKFSATYNQGYLPPNCLAVRELVAKAGLVEGKDIHFLGYLGDDEMLDMFQRCSAVVNAARFDNGCFNTLEAAYFGHPAVCTRYPAAEYLIERFGLPVHFYPVNDDAGLADALEAALAEPPRSEAEVGRMRAHLMSPEFSSVRYAERFYDVMVELAEKGRRLRAGGPVAGTLPARGPSARAA
jgi:glycosyltransferase involved in cell wall biosynthesis